MNMVISPPILIMNSSSLASLVWHKILERRMEKRISESGYHELQQELAKYLRRLKSASFGGTEHRDFSISTPPQSATTLADDKELGSTSLSAQSTMVSENNSGISVVQSNDQSSKKEASGSETPPLPRLLARTSSSSISLEKLQEAYSFLDKFLVTTRYIRRPFKPGQSCSLKFFVGIGRLLKCLYSALRGIPRLVYGLCTKQTRTAILVPLINYVHLLPSHRLYQVNKFLDGIWDQPNHRTVSPDYLILAIKLRTINKPPPSLNKKDRISNAILSLLTCFVLIISV